MRRSALSLDDFMRNGTAAMTSNVEDLRTQPSAREMLLSASKLLCEPRPIGSLYGFPVYVDPSMQPGLIEIRGAGAPVRFAVDHPYIDGTEIQKAALKALQR